MIKITSIIIAKNESKNIEKCIESQLNIIDEIIVLVDDTTTDNTYEIACRYEKVVCESIKWMGYAKTKQYAVNKAKNDWIFWIDADEAVREDLAQELQKFKKNIPDYYVYSVSRRAYFINKWIKHCGWYPARVNRLFNRNYAKFSESQVHEFLVFTGKAGRLNNDLDHFTDPDLVHYFEKFNKYTSLAAEQLYIKNRKAGFPDLIFRPVFMFFKMYILKRGVMDGIHGFVLSMLSSAYVFTKYAKLWEKGIKRKNQ